MDSVFDNERREKWTLCLTMKERMFVVICESMEGRKEDLLQIYHRKEESKNLNPSLEFHTFLRLLYHDSIKNRYR